MALDITVHKNILIHILKDIFTNYHIASFLGFKGGTAALFFYNLPRFSVDLDFDIFDLTKKQEVFESIKNILEQYGTVKVHNKRYSLFFLLSYHNKKAEAQNIKIEINKRNFNSTYQVMNYLGIAMQVMIKADMAAHKLVAMHERIGKTNRDIFDVWFFLKNNWPVNTKIIELRTGMDYKVFLQTCIKELENMGNRGILSGIGELLDAQQKAWAKSKLRDETIFLLKLAANKDNL